MKSVEKKIKLIAKLIENENISDSGTYKTFDCNPYFNVNSCNNFSLGFQSSFRYNIFESIFIDVCTEVEELFGIPKKEILGKDAAELFYEIIPDGSMEALGDLIQKSYLICKDHCKSKSLVLNIDFNIVSRNKKIKRILCQYRPVVFSMNNYPVETIGYWTDITHIKKNGLPSMFAMIDNKIEYLEFANPEYLIKSSNNIFTSKEIELIKMTNDGLIIKEISHKMKISISTVYTHRKNIKMKSEKGLNQVINELKSKGII